MSEPDLTSLARLIVKARASLSSADRDLIVRYMVARALARSGLADAAPIAPRRRRRQRPPPRRRDPHAVRRSPR
ncbi:MAG: hypothetical protein J0M02_05230 [Planctomycetes bacterium]|nr:hypothetical protein [Planctomycetota bacterium]